MKPPGTEGLSILTIINAGWFGVLVGSILSIAGIVLGVVLYRRAKPIARLRTTRVDQPLIGLPDSAVPGRLELRYEGSLVTRVSVTSIGLWNDGTQTFRGSDIVEREKLRIGMGGQGRLLHASIEAVTRQVIDVRLEPIMAEKLAHITFDFLDPGDGFRLRALHTGEPEELLICGVLRGLPAGLTSDTPRRSRRGWLGWLTLLAANGVAVGATSVGFLDFARNASWTSLFIAAGAAVAFFGGFLVIVQLEKLWRRRRTGGVPQIILDDPALEDRLTDPD